MRPFNFEVREKQYNDSTEKIIRRFIKKTSKTNLLAKILEKKYFKKDSDVERHLRNKKKFIKRKINEEYLRSLEETVENF